MKKVIAIIFFALFFIPLSADELVIFIPGWFSEWINYSSHRKLLSQLFPGAELHIGKWNSNRLWKNAKSSASDAVKELAGQLDSAAAPERITLIGHSLGGRIIIDCAEQLARRKLKVKQIILLGTAGKITERKLNSLQNISSEPVINICCPEDNILKIYCQEENEIPLGFSGIPRPVSNFRQFRMEIPDNSLKIGDFTLLSAKSMEAARQTAAHLAIYYFKTLQLAFDGQCPEYYLDYAELEQLASRGSCQLNRRYGFSESEEYCSWKFSRHKNKNLYRITTPAGKSFYFYDLQIAQRNFREVKQRLLSASVALGR